MKNIGLLIVFLFFVAGCSSTQPATLLSMTKTFDEVQAKSYVAAGPNTIKGSAFIRQLGGGVVTCAGNEVYAIPATAYADERMWGIYGSYQKGFRSTIQGPIEVVNENSAYRDTILKTQCDVLGSFKFSNVADASFYIVTNVNWSTGNARQGGSLMQKVNVWRGETKEIILVP